MSCRERVALEGDGWRFEGEGWRAGSRAPAKAVTSGWRALAVTKRLEDHGS